MKKSEEQIRKEFQKYIIDLITKTDKQIAEEKKIERRIKKREYQRRYMEKKMLYDPDHFKKVNKKNRDNKNGIK